jgi:hypothetical protein
MRWNFFDYCLLTIVIASLVLAGGSYVQAQWCNRNCRMIYTYKSLVVNSCFSYEFVDCRPCMILTAGWCTLNTSQEDCVEDETLPQQACSFSGCQPSCPTEFGGRVEAATLHPINPTWAPSGFVHYCE